MKKTLLTLLLTLCVCLPAPAETATPVEADYLGAWYANDVLDGENTFPAALHGLDGYAFNFLEGGAYTGVYDFAAVSGTWALNADGSVSLERDGETPRAELRGGRLLFDLFGDGSLYICMDRESDAAREIPAARADATEADFLGVWRSNGYAVNAVCVPFADGEPALTLTIAGDGTAELRDGENDVPGVWTVREGTLFLEGGDDVFSATLCGKLLVLDGEDFAYVFQKEQ